MRVPTSGPQAKVQRVEKGRQGETKERMAHGVMYTPSIVVLHKTQLERFHPSLDYFCPKCTHGNDNNGSKSKDIGKEKEKGKG